MLINIRRKLSQCQRGQALVEFTLAATAFLVMLMALIDYSLLIYHKHAINRAAYEAARVGASGFSGTRITDAEARANAVLTTHKLYTARATVLVQDVSLSLPSVEAVVSYPYDFMLIPLPLPTINLTTTATMRREG